jgi:hypothetical protein
MLVATGILLGVVLRRDGRRQRVDATGRWLALSDTARRSVPRLVGTLVQVVPTWETMGLQLSAAVLVVGSYFAAEYLKVRKPRRRGEEPRRPRDRARASAFAVARARTRAALLNKNEGTAASSPPSELDDRRTTTAFLLVAHSLIVVRSRQRERK